MTFKKKSISLFKLKPYIKVPETSKKIHTFWNPITQVVIFQSFPAVLKGK
jgi:hypothetical protein